MIQPRPYQTDAFQAFWRELATCRRQLMVLPTGTGKTIVFAMLAAHMKPRRTLVIAHRDELIYQAVDKLHLVAPELDIGVVKAEQNDAQAQVVVASIQTIRQPARLAALGHFDLVVVDEAHHAVADTYRYVLSRLQAGMPGGPPLFGVTATPERSDFRTLQEVFDRITYQRSILWMIEAGYLCDLRARQVYLSFDLSRADSGQDHDDYDGDALAEAMVDADAPDEIARAYRQFAQGRRGLVFAPNVMISELITEQLLKHHIRAAHLDYLTPMRRRRQVLADLHRGALDLVCNCGLLTEGYDEPRVDVIICARPTKFRGLYQQMVGRGTRLYPGKNDCLILDVVGNTARHSMQTLDRLFQLKPMQSVLEAFDDERQPMERATAEDLAQDAVDKMGRHVPLKSRLVDMFRGAHVAWKQTKTGDWFINLGKEVGTLIIRQYPAGGQLAVDGDPTAVRSTRWQVQRLVPGSSTRLETQAQDVTLDYAYGIARDYIAQVPRWQIDEQAAWRDRAASERQLELLGHFGLPAPLTLTRGEAFDTITQHQIERALLRQGQPPEAATSKQLALMRAEHIAHDPGVSKAEARELIAAFMEAKGEA